MIHTPRRQYTKFLALLIRLHQIRKVCESEGDVVHPRSLAFVQLRLRARVGDEGDAVMLMTILEECHNFVLEDDCDAEEESPEVDHALEVGAAEDDVCEGDGADDFAAAGFDGGSLSFGDGHG